MAEPEPPSDEELFAAYVARGDRQAFETLFRRYAPRLSGMFVRSGARESAGDLVQKTFLHVHRARADYQLGRPFRPWIYTIALNVRREEARKKARSRETAIEPERVREPSIEPTASSPSDRLVQRALDKLSDSAREVVVLHWYDGHSFPEIAEMLGASLSAVKVRAHRAYEQLRKMLDPDGEGR